MIDLEAIEARYRNSCDDADWQTILELVRRLREAECELRAARALIQEARLVQDLDVMNHPLCNSDLRGINDAFKAYDKATSQARKAMGE